MLTSNRVAVLVVGFLTGAGVNMGLIGAQSYLLSVTHPVYATIATMAVGILFSVFIRRFELKATKYARFSFGVLVVYSGLLAFLSVGALPPLAQAVSWLALAIAGSTFFRWNSTQLSQRHLNPATAQTYFVYLATAVELGTVAAVGLIFFGPWRFEPLGMVRWSLAAFGALALFELLQFVPGRNLEIHYTSKTEGTLNLDRPEYRGFVLFFAAASFLFGAFRFTEDYAVKVVLKAELESFERIRDITASYSVVISAVVIALTLGTGRIVARFRTSPITLLYVHAGVLAVAAAVAGVKGGLIAFIALEAATRISERCLYTPANQMTLASFISKVRNRLSALQSSFYYALAPAPLAVAFFLTRESEVYARVGWLVGALVLVAGAAAAAVWRMRPFLVEVMYDCVRSPNKEASVLAVQGLSYLRPRDYAVEMTSLLRADPKKLLRKTIILGLGYLRDEHAIETIRGEFKTDKEEIQIAVLDALKTADRHSATQFIANIVSAKEKPKSLRVRMNAAAIIAGIYGRKAIPFLLNGLDDPDERIVANTLEVLSMYRDPSLAPYFEEYAGAQNQRVKANALMGLGRLWRKRDRYYRGMREMLNGDARSVASALYVVGKLRARRFSKEIKAIWSSPVREDPVVNRCLAWALTRLGDRRGPELFAALFRAPYQESQQQIFLHFLSQMEKDSRFELLRVVAGHGRMTREEAENLILHLRHSIFDFHEEIEYLKVVSRIE